MSKASREERVQAVREEFVGVELGDERLNRRVVQLAAAMTARPRVSFPELMTDGAELEALYRFHSNKDVTYDAILAPHVEATARRCRAAKTVLAVHDMTEFSFSGQREGLTEAGEKSTFYGHFTLAVRPDAGEDGVPMALGLLGLQPFLSNRGSKGIRSRGNPAPKASRAKRYRMPREEKESFLWDVGVLASQAAAGPEVHLIHVADQEVDDYGHFALLAENQMRFVIRGAASRRVQDAEGVRQPARQALEDVEVKLLREVSVSERKKPQNSHPRRRARLATLQVHATRVLLPPTKSTPGGAAVGVNIVHVFEPRPPSAEEAIEWMLYTSEPIATAEDLEFIVDAYRARWTIEELFKALKTGCAYEERQLCSGHALLNVLALCIPIAWRMLALRSAVRSTEGDSPASRLFSPWQLKLLRVLRPKAKLGRTPSLREVLLTIAALGGHLKRNGDPGWLTLWRGYDEFLRAQHVASAMQRAGRTTDL